MAELPSKAELREAIAILGEHRSAGLLADILAGRWTLVDEHAESGVRPVNPVDLMITPEVRAACGKPGPPVERHTLLRWREKRGFPEPIRSIKVGRGKNAQTVEIWDRREVRQWLREHPPL